MLNNKDIECAMNILEKDIVAITNNYSSKYRDDLRQDVRIKSWEYINNSFESDCVIDNNKSLVDNIVDFVKSNLYYICLMASKAIIRQGAKDNKRFVDIDKVEFSIYDNTDNIDFEIDFDKYKTVLSDKELVIIQYLFSGNESFMNFDNIARQLGYTGKGGTKYLLNVIAKKIINFQNSPKSVKKYDLSTKSN